MCTIVRIAMLLMISITEAMRKYPPLPFLPRKCTETYTVPGSDLVLEKGQLVFIPILGLQRDRVHYPDPERFDPDRFTAEAKANRSPCLWLPFGEGPRICIGRLSFVGLSAVHFMLNFVKVQTIEHLHRMVPKVD